MNKWISPWRLVHTLKFLAVVSSLSLSLLAALSLLAPAMSATCDLGSETLPEKKLPVQLDGALIDVRIGGHLEFKSEEGNLYTITEITYGKLDRAKTVISRLILDEVGALPNEECGTRATLGDIGLSVSAGNLIISIPLNGEQWDTFIGICGLLASGTLSFEALFTPEIVEFKLVLHPNITHTGELQSTVPAIDDSITQMIDTRLEEATSNATGVVNGAVEKLRGKLDAIQSNVDDPLEAAKAVYHPEVKYIGFSLENGTLTLTQKRQAQAREGTTCAIRRLALETWNSGQ